MLVSGKFSHHTINQHNFTRKKYCWLQCHTSIVWLLQPKATHSKNYVQRLARHKSTRRVNYTFAFLFWFFFNVYILIRILHRCLWNLECCNVVVHATFCCSCESIGRLFAEFLTTCVWRKESLFSRLSRV